MTKPMGQILIDRGILSPTQRDQVLRAQRGTNRPFGELAETMFGVCQRQIEDVWAEQYAQIAHWVDPSAMDIPHHVLCVLSGRQAAQFALIPIRYAGRSLVLCTTKDQLPRALRFASATFGAECTLALCEPEQFSAALRRHYDVDAAAWDALMRQLDSTEAA
ncbi:MAG: hypothetical protein KatS3mg103_0280 [Phycisphaerales bacterium]|nr:MAG: hypothetical protein KatS3mg103_0280 [Phycisphaerales bacterium]